MARARKRGLSPLCDADHSPGRPPGAVQGGCQRATPVRLSGRLPVLRAPTGCPRPAGRCAARTRGDPPADRWSRPRGMPAVPALSSSSALQQVAQQVDCDALLAQPFDARTRPREPPLPARTRSTPDDPRRRPGRCSAPRRTDGPAWPGPAGAPRTRERSASPGPGSRGSPLSRRPMAHVAQHAGSCCPSVKPSRSSATKRKPADCTAATTSWRRASTAPRTSASNSSAGGRAVVAHPELREPERTQCRLGRVDRLQATEGDRGAVGQAGGQAGGRRLVPGAQAELPRPRGGCRPW